MNVRFEERGNAPSPEPSGAACVPSPTQFFRLKGRLRGGFPLFLVADPPFSLGAVTGCGCFISIVW
jgi:hypothetical protein